MNILSVGNLTGPSKRCVLVSADLRPVKDYMQRRHEPETSLIFRFLNEQHYLGT